MLKFTSRIALAASIVFAPTPGFAEDAPSTTVSEAPAESAPNPQPADAPAAAVPSAGGAASPGDDEKFSRKGFNSAWGIGPAILWLPDRYDRQKNPAIFFESRSIVGMSDHVGFEWITDLTIHDFEMMEDAYGWFNEGDRDTVIMKYFLLWPGLLLIPFAGSNLATGFGLVGWSSPGVPAFWFDAGVQMALFVRPSDNVIPIDVGFQTYAGLGFDFSESIGMGFRFLYGPAAFSTVFHDADMDIITASVFLGINSY